MRVIYAVPGMVLATLFVTVPFVVRELVPVLASWEKSRHKPPKHCAQAAGGPSGASLCLQFAGVWLMSHTHCGPIAG